MKYLHNINRVAAFSDSVFAFAATLLVVSVGYEKSSSVIQIDWVAFIGFGVSFFVLVALWWLHYNFFRRAKYIDNWIIVINTVLLFVVLYYIFPLKSMVNTMAGRQRLSIDAFFELFQLYSLGFLLIFSCYSLMYYRAYRQTKNKASDYDLLFYSRHFAIYIVVALASIVISKLQIGLSFVLPGIVYVLLGPFCYFHGIRFRKKFQTDEE